MKNIFLVFVLFLVACNSGNEQTSTKNKTDKPVAEQVKSEKKQSSNKVTPPAMSTLPASKEIVLNEDTQTLVEGYWKVLRVVQIEPTERYQKMIDHYYQFNKNGTYQVLKPDQTVLHHGNWTFDDFRHIRLSATNQAYNNHYLLKIMGDAAVFLGTEDFGNTDIQMRLDQVRQLPSLQ